MLSVGVACRLCHLVWLVSVGVACISGCGLCQWV